MELQQQQDSESRQLKAREPATVEDDDSAALEAALMRGCDLRCFRRSVDVKTQTSAAGKENSRDVGKENGSLSILDKGSLNASVVLRMIQRDLNLIGSLESLEKRKKSLLRLKELFFPDGKPALSHKEMQKIFPELQKPLLKRLSDPSERCRELSISILIEFFLILDDFGPTLPYLFPAVIERCSDDFTIDFEEGIVVRDIEEHEAKRRGRAISLPDGGTIYKHCVYESSEEIRLLLCQLMSTVTRSLTKMNLHSILGPYFHELVMFFHACAVDPCPELKIKGFEELKLMSECKPFEATMHHYCTALVRSIMPALRHRQSRVRIRCMSAIKSLVACPFRDKQKGGGTDAIADLMGFREDNVIPICAFYQGETRLNYLGFLITDENAGVRYACYECLAFWLTSLLDRWDHPPRLLPFFMAALSDENERAQFLALETLEELGKEYESENPDEVIERRQYGVDGADAHMYLSKPLPSPWTQGRPRLGTRLYVRKHCKRFLGTVLRELNDWRSTTKAHASGLLKTMLIYLEEHVTMELHELIDALVRYVLDETIGGRICEIAELVGRYVPPRAYLELVLPHIEGGDGSMTLTSGDKWNSTIPFLLVLSSMLDGTKPSETVKYMTRIQAALMHSTLLRAGQERPQMREALLRCMKVLSKFFHGENSQKAMVESHFLASGRLGYLELEIERLADAFLALGEENEAKKLSCQGMMRRTRKSPGFG